MSRGTYEFPICARPQPTDSEGRTTSWAVARHVGMERWERRRVRACAW